MINSIELSSHLERIESATVPFISRAMHTLSPSAAGNLVGFMLKHLSQKYMSKDGDEFRRGVAEAIWTAEDVRRTGS